jgi:transcriptional regulator with XRE-family HTH domain
LTTAQLPTYTQAMNDTSFNADAMIKRRLQMNLSQQELADLADVSIWSIQRYENQRSKPRFDELQRLAHALGRSVNFFTKRRAR